MNLLIGHFLGRYHILEQLGEGGMAVVYKAYDTHLEHEVAVKVIRLDNLPRNAEERALKRFEREAKAVARLDHANIVKVTDYGEHEGSPYLVMPYLPGGTLKQYLKEHGSMDWREATRMLKPLAEALAYAHEQGLIHRDVKPSNILLTTRGEPMLTDFGVAKVVDDEVTQDLTGTSATVGTPEYMAPEQVVSKSVDHRADIYALGVVFFEMVTGRRPFEADTPMAVLFKHASAPLPRPKGYKPDLPDGVERVLLKALAKRPEDRYQTMKEMGRAIEQVITKQGETGFWEGNENEESALGDAGVLTTIDEFVTRDEGMERVKLWETRQPEGLSGKEEERGGFSGWKKLLVIVGVGLLGMVLVIGLTKRAPAKTEAETEQWVSPTVMETEVITATTESPTQTPTEVPPTPTVEVLAIGSTKVRDQDGMEVLFVPSGEFIMGISNQDLEWYKQQDWCTEENYCQSLTYQDSMPAHSVYLDSFWVDKFEVTNDQYKKCVNEGVCTQPYEYYWITDYYTSEDYDNHPVINVSWVQAAEYCDWVEGRLPTEAEWEKAARGIDGRLFPWGNQAPYDVLVDFSPNSNNMSQAGSHPAGLSYYGAMDMAGNAWEWVYDWYDESYYEVSPSKNPKGPETGQFRILRGTAQNYRWMVNAFHRFYEPPEEPDFISYFLGFRCVMDEKD